MLLLLLNVAYKNLAAFKGVHLVACFGPQRFGLSQLREGASSQSLRSILCVLTLLFYNTYVSLILGRKIMFLFVWFNILT